MAARAKIERSRTKAAPAEPNIYVGLLFVSVAALLTACIFLVLELYQYEWTMAQ